MAKYGVILVVLGSMLWGTDSLFRRPLTRTLSPITIVYLEHCILAIVVLPAVINVRRKIDGLHAKEWGCLVFVALGGSVAATSLFTFSIKHGNPSVTVLLQKTQPLFTLLLARWFLQERPDVWFWRLCPGPLPSIPSLVRDWVRLAITDEPSISLPPQRRQLWEKSTVLKISITRLPGRLQARFRPRLPALAPFLAKPSGTLVNRARRHASVASLAAWL